MSDLKVYAQRALECLDLTNLNDDCTNSDVLALCKRAQTPFGTAAAVCIWPRFVATAAKALAGTNIKIATVVNFPTGNESASDVMDMTKQAVQDGAHEIDVVVPWKALLEGHPENVSARVARVKASADGARVKAIIEVGMLIKPDLVREATRGAIDGEADFVKTSTGKVPINATPEFARIILEEIKAVGEDVGFKAAGGVKTTEDAAEYLQIADKIMGDGWAEPNRFRFGASGVLDALLATLKDKAAPDAGTGY